MSYQIFSDMTQEEVELVDDKLTAFSDQFTGPRNLGKFGLVLRDHEGEVFGGITGSTMWDWLHISVLWVSEDLRGKGHGKKLMAAAEKTGKKRGCKFARLHTFEFQAREFYESQGYRVINQTEDFPKGHVQFLMTKAL